MPERNRTDVRKRNLRSALVLGAVLAAILIVAGAISVWIYTELDRAAGTQRTLVDAELQLDELVRTQLDQETGLRGFLVSGQRLFLQPYSNGHADFTRRLHDFKAVTASLGIGEMTRVVTEIGALHDAWEREVAGPLLRHPRAKDALIRETLGKVQMDQLRGDTARVRQLLEGRIGRVQDVLKFRIDEALIGGLASVLVFGLVCIVFVASRQQMLAEIDRERSIVETLQGAFQTDVDVLPGSRIGTAYVSADSDAAVGGDLYDVRRIDATRGLLLVADVSGKGIQAAVNTAFVKYSMRTLARIHEDPGQILSHFNRIFLETISDPNLFVVAFVGVLDARDATLTYASAGHSGAYLRRGPEVHSLAVTGPVLGLDVSFGYETRRVALADGDMLVLATDGLSEARNGDGALLDDEGAMELLRESSLEPQLCADELVEAVRSRSGGIVRDDLALLVVGIDGSA